MTKPKILAFAGSTREASYNKLLVKIAAAGARNAGAEVTEVDLRDFPMPLFDQDLEEKEGMPETARQFQDLIRSHQGFLIASPEYNSSITAVLKNAIDWASRPDPGEPILAMFSGKVAGIMSASPGGLGGLRGLASLREMLANMNMLVIPEQKAIPQAFQAFNDDGNLSDEKDQEAIANIGASVATVVAKLHS
jgi:NAD(P)H-dependent FMN reductase